METGDFRNFIIGADSSHSVQLIVVDPVSNLIDMPPFAGENDSGLTDLIQAFDEVVKKGEIPEIEKFLSQHKAEIDTAKGNANIQFLHAEAISKIEKKIDLAGFEAARDLDVIPFRARSDVQGALKALLDTQQGPLIHYVATTQAIVSKFGAEGFGNGVFIDHLHFTFQGNALIAQLVTNVLQEIYRYNDDQKQRIALYFSNPVAIKESLHITPANDLNALTRIEKLAQADPWVSMQIKFVPPSYKTLLNNYSFKTSGLESDDIYQALKSEGFDAVVGRLLSQYGEAHNNSALSEYINMLITVSPRFYYGYLCRAQYYFITGNLPLGLADLRTAYELSGSNPENYMAMRALYQRYIGTIGQFNVNFGTPPESK